MTFPCINEDQFDMVDGTHLTPLPHMQWRHVATNTLASNTYSFAVTGALPAQNLAELQVQWTNNSPIDQIVYCMLTRDTTQVITQARGKAFIETYFAVTQGLAPADPNPTPGTLIGRFGNGSDIDNTGTPTEALFYITETRTAARTYPIGANITLPPTHTYKVRIRLRWDGIAWESGTIDGGNTNETEAGVTTGASRLDLFSIPVIT